MQLVNKLITPMLRFACGRCVTEIGHYVWSRPCFILLPTQPEVPSCFVTKPLLLL